MKPKKIEDQYKKLTDIDHCLVRPAMYIGSIKFHDERMWVIDNQSMIMLDVKYNPGFLKLFDEIIMNSVDESKRGGSKLNTIKITVDQINNRIIVWDNGGIPIIKHKIHKEWIPEMVFSNLKTGSNFNDDEMRYWSGTNGVGAVVTNIYSKEFTVKTCDGVNVFSQTFSNNMRKRTAPLIKKSKKGFTEISYEPDLSRFEMDKIDDDTFKLIEKRVYDISGCNPSIKFYFNDKLINIKSFEDYIKYYTGDYIYETNKDKSWAVALSLSNNGFQSVSFVNSTSTYDNGTHVDYIMNQIVVYLREYFQKKHKVDIKPSELKNHMFLFLNSTISNPSFSSQTKEKLITEIKDLGDNFRLSNKFLQSILKTEIINSIVDWIDRKKDAEESKAKRELNKKLNNIKVEKLIDAKGRNRLKYSIGLFEGDSSVSSFRKYRDPETMGAFALRGKVINVSEITNQKLVQNQEIINMMASIGLKLGQTVDLKELRYGKILFYVDADHDGNSIAGLLLNFFFKFWPEVFEKRMIYKVETPILVAVPVSKNKKKLQFYTDDEYNQWCVKNDLKKYEIKYKKGLASLTDDEYEEIIKNPKLTLITKDDLSDKCLDIWFGKNTELRKEELLK
jgi:DNA topoisomerase II